MRKIAKFIIASALALMATTVKAAVVVGPVSTLYIMEEGVAVSTNPVWMNFVGSGVTAAKVGTSSVTITVTATGGTPGGNDENIQVNGGGTFTGEDNFTYSTTTKTMQLMGTAGAQFGYSGIALIGNSYRPVRIGSGFGTSFSERYNFFVNDYSDFVSGNAYLGGIGDSSNNKVIGFRTTPAATGGNPQVDFTNMSLSGYWNVASSITATTAITIPDLGFTTLVDASTGAVTATLPDVDQYVGLYGAYLSIRGDRYIKVCKTDTSTNTVTFASITSDSDSVSPVPAPLQFRNECQEFQAVFVSKTGLGNPNSYWRPTGRLAGQGISISSAGVVALMSKNSNSTYVAFKAPDTVSANVIWTLPGADASGCFQSNGSGVVSIASCGSGGGGGTTIWGQFNEAVISNAVSTITTQGVINSSVTASSKYAIFLNYNTTQFSNAASTFTANSSTFTLMGNTFNAASKLLQLDGSALVPSAQIPTNLSAYIQNANTLQSGSTAYPDFLNVGSSASVNGPVVIVATTSTPALKITANGTYGTTDGTSGGFLINCTGGGGSSGECAQFYTNASTQAALGGIVNVIQALAQNTWNEPGVYIKMNSTNGGAANIRNDGPAPQIEWVETDQVSPAGKYEDGVNGDIRYLAGRKGDNSGFENFVELARPDASGGGYVNFVSSRTPVRFSDGAGTHYVAFRASGTIASNFTMVWPSVTGGVNTVMQTDGSNNLFFGAVSSLTATGVSAASYGSATQVPTFTVDAQGRLSAASNTTISISTTNLNATGTASATTFLRGDNTWATPAGSGAGDVVLASTQAFSGGNTFNSWTTFNGSVTFNNGGQLALNNMTFSINIGTGIAIVDAGTTFIVMPSTGLSNTTDMTTTSATLGNATYYAFPIAANETWSFEFNLFMTGVSGGTEFGFNGPAGSTVTATMFGDTSAVGTFSAASVTALNTADTVAFNTTAAAIVTRITGTLAAGGTSGTVQFMWKSVTGGNTSTIKAGSYMVARRIL